MVFDMALDCYSHPIDGKYADQKWVYEFIGSSILKGTMIFQNEQINLKKKKGSVITKSEKDVTKIGKNSKIVLNLLIVFIYLGV